MDQFFGLPAHPLLVHLPVVLLPLSMVGVILMLVRPGWRGSLLLPTAAIGAVGAIGAILASNSGEWLAERVKDTSLVHTHGELGEMTRNLAILFAGSLFVWALRALLEQRGQLDSGRLGRLLGPKWVATLAVAGSVVFGTLTTVWVVRAGHTGAKAAWEGKVSDTPRDGAGERANDGD